MVPVPWHLLRNLPYDRSVLAPSDPQVSLLPATQHQLPPYSRTHCGGSEAPDRRLASRSSASLTLFPGPAQLATCVIVGVRGGAGRAPPLREQRLTSLKPLLQDTCPKAAGPRPSGAGQMQLSQVTGGLEGSGAKGSLCEWSPGGLLIWLICDRSVCRQAPCWDLLSQESMTCMFGSQKGLYRSWDHTLQTRAQRTALPCLGKQT